MRVFLLGGLVLHKAVWEILKRRDQVTAVPRLGGGAQLLSAVKVLILLGIITQTLVPDVFPIRADATALRIAGIVLFASGLLTAISARIELGRNWSDIEKSEVGRDHALVAHGVYRYIRHPIYTGDLLLIAGLELALNSWLVLVVPILGVYVWRKAVYEEKVLMYQVPGYSVYYRSTSRFIPFLI